ncbi:hypothetical protein TYRP_016231 [Tyrophagus putrescentiae]|nr:hypothetical protein TYRP_016231 [Tyrophagus putrescentiae]
MSQVLLDVDKLIKLLIKISNFKSMLIFDMFSGELPAEKMATTKILFFLFIIVIIFIRPKALKRPHAEVLSLVVEPITFFGKAKFAKTVVFKTTQSTGKRILLLKAVVLGKEISNLRLYDYSTAFNMSWSDLCSDDPLEFT